VNKCWVLCIATAMLLSAGNCAATTVRRSGIVMIDGVPHPYLTEGVGYPCIAVGLVFPPLFSDRIKQHIRFIFVDYKNSWEAEASQDVEKITMDRLVEEVDQVRQALGLEKVCVVGYSLPGLVAIEYLLRHPERVSYGILLGVPPAARGLRERRASFWENDASAERKAAYQRNVEKLPDTLLQSLTPRDAFVFRYVRDGPRYFFDPSYDIYWAWAERSFSLDVLNHYFNLLADYDPRPRLSANTVPIFVAQGRYDYAVPYDLWDEIKGKIPHLRYEFFTRSGHFVSIEEPGLFDQKLVRWLETTTSMRK
jgi:proline iminopeptidase